MNYLAKINKYNIYYPCIMLHLQQNSNNIENILSIDNNLMQSTQSIYGEIPMTLMNVQPTNTTTSVEEKRKPCEHPWSELVLAVALFVPTNSINIMDDCKTLIENNKIRLNHSIDLEKYENEINLKNKEYENEINLQNKKNEINLNKKSKNIKNEINDYITTWYEKIEEETIFKQQIKCVYVSGKTNKHEEIELLNKNYKDRKDVKSDLYIEFMSGEMIGISVKNDSKAPKSNYSVHKMINSIEKNLKNESNDYCISKIHKDYLIENGIEKIKKTDSEEEKKKKRKDFSGLFYDSGKNPYCNILRGKLKEHDYEIKHRLVNLLYSSNIHYPVYEFDGNTLVRLNIDKMENEKIDFKEHQEYYITKNGTQRNCAKLFYQLIVNNKKYRVEIRWKGDCFASPQFLIHSDE